MRYAVLDFETAAIAQRPQYPPEPAGYALKMPGRAPVYKAWGHPTANNCSREEGIARLQELWASELPIVFHNAKFDLAVATEKLGLPMLPWQRIHDTMLLLFLKDPHAASFALKAAAEELLGMPPAERDAVRDWLEDAGIVRKGAKDWGAHIAEAPGKLVGEYACADTLMTAGLLDLLGEEPGLQTAYIRERQLLPVLLRNEREGVCVNLRRLRRDAGAYTLALEQADDWLRNRLGDPGLNIDSDRNLADALTAGKLVTRWRYTDTGQKSVAKDSLLEEDFRDIGVFRVLNYRNKLKTSLATFMLPWLATAEATGGRIHTSWNQVRSYGGGARTGRLSSSPNFQNLPKSFERGGYQHPETPKLPHLPLLRSYIEPDPGCIIIQRDYSQQELRILAHFEDGALLHAYNDTPRMDIHDYVQERIQTMRGIILDRGQTKTLNFGLLYGMGLSRLAEALKCSVAEARAIKDAQRAALPGLGTLEQRLKNIGRAGGAICTWGGREYFVEPPKVVDGQMRTFEYKLLNYLIQGSAADCTKEALIRYDAMSESGRLMINVHDELLVSVPHSGVEPEMRILKAAMESVEFDVPMLTDGKTGPHWEALSKYPEM